MNALPLISHRLLVAAVPERRSARGSVAAEKKSVIIDCNDNSSAVSPVVEKSVSTVPVIMARRPLAPAMIGASWPFFE